MDDLAPASDQPGGHREEFVRDMFPYRDVSPEEYVARHSHQIGCFSLDRYKYLDAELGRWLLRLGQILRDPPEVDRCRRVFLSPTEYAAVQRDLEDTMRYGL